MNPDASVPPSPRTLDAIDRQIVRVLLTDARISMADLAERVSVSRANLYSRVDRLKRDGVIRGSTTLIDPAALGYALHVFVGFQLQPGVSYDSLRETTDQILQLEGVQNVHVVTGRWDFLVELRLRDHEHLRSTLLQGFGSIPLFGHTETMLSVEHRSAGQDQLLPSTFSFPHRSDS